MSNSILPYILSILALIALMIAGAVAAHFLQKWRNGRNKE